MPPANQVTWRASEQHGAVPPLERRCRRQHGACESFTQLEPRAGEKPARKKGATHGTDEVFPGDAVTVDKDEMAPTGVRRAKVPHAGQTEAVVILPSMDEPVPETVLPTVDDRLGGRGRPVIRDHNVERIVGLVCETSKDGIERLWPLVRRDDHAQRR
jgi:hypothetical protein